VRTASLPTEVPDVSVFSKLCYDPEQTSGFFILVPVTLSMGVDKAKCPHCGSLISGDDVETLSVDDGRIGPMGTGTSTGEVLYVCPSCNTILG